MQRIHIGSTAKIVLMGYAPALTGHVESIGRGIDDSNDAPGSQGLPDVESTFSWVRLAQRIPVRIHIDHLPNGLPVQAQHT